MVVMPRSNLEFDQSLEPELQVNTSLALGQGSVLLQRSHRQKSNATQEARHESKSIQVQDKTCTLEQASALIVVYN